MRNNLFHLVPALLLIAGLVACGEEEDENPPGDTTDTPVDTNDPIDTGETGDTGEPAANEDCQAVSFPAGSSGTYTVSTGDDHVKHHFYMPADITHLIISPTWDTDWTMAVDVGVGTCPHSGTSYLSESGESGMVIDVYAADLSQYGYGDSFTENEQWFVHLGVASSVSTGDTADYEIEVQACVPL